MKEADPTITLNVGVPSAAQWLAPLFSKTAGAVDEVQTGFYFAPDRNITMEDCLYAPVHDVLPTLQGLRRSIESIAPAEKDLGISYYEWNVMWDRSGDARSGVFAGGMLNMLCREAAALGAVRASYFQPVTEGAIRVGPRDSTLEPDGQVFALYAAHQGNQLLEPAFDSSGAIDLCASLAPQGGEIFATVINRNETTPCKLRISLVDFPALRSASAEFLTPGTGGECEGFAHTEEALQTVVGREIVAELPPRSIAGLRLNMQEGNKE